MQVGQTLNKAERLISAQERIVRLQWSKGCRTLGEARDWLQCKVEWPDTDSEACTTCGRLMKRYGWRVQGNSPSYTLEKDVVNMSTEWIGRGDRKRTSEWFQMGRARRKPRSWWRVGCSTNGMTRVGWGTGFVGRLHLAG